MNEQPERENEQDPGPVQDSDAEMVTGEQKEDAPQREDPASSDDGES